jgi:hypothetical protein
MWLILEIQFAALFPPFSQLSFTIARNHAGKLVATVAISQGIMLYVNVLPAPNHRGGHHAVKNTLKHHALILQRKVTSKNA